MADFPWGVVFFDLGMTLVAKDSKKWAPGAPEALAGLRAGGVRLGVISNTGGMKRDELQGLLPPDFDWNLFDTELIVLSGEVGVEKPDRAVFEKAVEKAGVSAKRCMYCSEDLLETLAAQRSGMAAARILPAGDGLAKLMDALRELAKAEHP